MGQLTEGEGTGCLLSEIADDAGFMLTQISLSIPLAIEDLVDRGSYGLEIILITFAYKWLYPNRCRLNRGNHEARSLNGMYGAY